MAKIDLKNKVVVIAGGAKNLGGLISREVAKQGSDVVVHFHSDSAKADAEKTVKAVESLGRKAIMVQSDLTKADNVKALFKKAKDAFGRVDVAVNTVGMVLKKPFAETSEAEFDTMSDINSKSAYFFIKEAGTNLENDGKIITIATSLLGAYTGLYATYAGGKAPVEHYTRAASKEFGDRGISVNSIAPGPMDTQFFYGQESPEAVAYHKSASALGGLTKIEDIVPIITFLATDGWWITGQTILANGGYTTK
ncbi:SDR family oxidoreductase [Maribacter hydrothermalis]|uniref:Short chain dehydrogenase n=1 Tax=Maribacter hydrothermalis TaxID=1836467 RepID=A0A1B7Z7L6_9FLAO|nr:SDR family oxidoreductase [Maribacter hydrothermalis]APQ15936.1 short chain dehydrogenase [Maribacter hydrothermalis]OBR38685.1 short chain dehydrogenase [Maribacter hydrothermalis]